MLFLQEATNNLKERKEHSFDFYKGGPKKSYQAQEVKYKDIFSRSNSTMKNSHLKKENSWIVESKTS